MQEKEVNVKPFLMWGALVCGSAEPSVIFGSAEAAAWY